MFESLMALWPMLQSAVSNPNTTQAAAQMSSLGDPDAVMKPLFADAQQWSPTYMGGATDSQQMQGAMTQRPQGPFQGFADMLGGMPGVPNGQAAYSLSQPPVQAPSPLMPRPQQQINLGNSAQMMDGTPRQVQTQQQERTQQGLTGEQYKQLMGMMPDQKGYVPPAPGVVAPRGLSGNMQMLDAGRGQVARRATLGDLIYGGR